MPRLEPVHSRHLPTRPSGGFFVSMIRSGFHPFMQLFMHPCIFLLARIYAFVHTPVIKSNWRSTMAFHEIQKGGFGAAQKTETVGACVTKAGAMTITVSGDIYKGIGSPSFAKVLLGSGKHAGFIAMIPRNMPGSDAYKFVQSGPKSYQRKISITASKIGLPMTAHATTSLPYEITEDGLVVDVRSLAKPVLVAAE